MSEANKQAKSGSASNDLLSGLGCWRGKRCSICGRGTTETTLNIEAVIHHGQPLICLDRKSCERLKRKQSSKSRERKG